ncbi:MAG: ABC transporter ATP-binding protein [Desulfobacterota bacterium]|nr:ABC transporter ATP-binding protein [Thermodesulfobacteriota bacterium]
MTLLEVRDLRVEREGELLLNIPSLSVKRGETLALIGPNGAGKTTLLQTLSFLSGPFHGEILFEGQRVGRDLSVLAYRRKIALVFQEPLLFNTTVFQNVASGLKIRNVKKREIQERVMEELERFGISHLSQRSAKTLSGGEAQRTNLARAFVLRPELLLLDEPFASLDPPTRESLLIDLERALFRTKTTTLFATHDRQEALRLSDRVAVMRSGRIEQIGSPEGVMNHPATEFVASFLGVETILSGRVIRTGEGTFVASMSDQEVEAVGEVRLGERVVLCIRPEDVTLAIPPVKGQTSARNLFIGRVSKIVPFGPYQKVHLDCGFPLVAYITHPSQKNLSLTEGKEVAVSFKASAVKILKKG